MDATHGAVCVCACVWLLPTVERLDLDRLKGTEGFGRMLDRYMELAQYLVKRLKEKPDRFQLIVHEPECVNVCFWCVSGWIYLFFLEKTTTAKTKRNSSFFSSVFVAAYRRVDTFR